VSSFSDDILEVLDAEVGEGCGTFAIWPINPNQPVFGFHFFDDFV
jgi:hypothetical protein